MTTILLLKISRTVVVVVLLLLQKFLQLRSSMAWQAGMAEAACCLLQWMAWLGAAPQATSYEFWDAFKLLLMFFTAVHSRGQNYGGGLARPSFPSHRLS